jgi:uncharacterized protein
LIILPLFDIFTSHISFVVDRMIKIKISNLADGHHDFQFNGNVTDLKLTEPFSDTYELVVSLDKIAHQIIITAKGEMDAVFDCDRCGAEIHTQIPLEFQLVYLSDTPAETNDDFGVVYITPDTEYLDLTSEIFDFAQLAVPMKRLCSEDCKGLCTVCGANLNEGDCGCDRTSIDIGNLPFSNLKNLINKNS